MSRVELDAIQTKLKAAILNHQMLVTKMKGDTQNPSFKSNLLSDVQEEIKRLSEEQKKIVMKLRETLVKSTSLPVNSPNSALPVLTMGQTITAIGQPRLVSISSQGGATILPIGMLAVPIAHVQRPTLGMALNPGAQMCAPGNLALQPADYASAVAAGTPIPTGIFNSGQAIPINSSIALQNSIAINNITSAINVNSLNGGLSLNNLNGGMNLNNLNSSGIGSVIGSGMAAAGSIGNIVIASKSRSQVNSSIVASSANNNTGVIVTSVSSTISSAPAIFANSGVKNAVVSAPNASGLEADASTSVSSSLVAGGQGIVVNEQPLVAPHLLQQQQQQILQMIQLQQPPQQRLASHFPIKVPQYTASPIRTIVSSTSVQYCNIAPAPMPFASTCSVRPSVIPTPAVIGPVKTDTSKTSSALNNVKEPKSEKQDQSERSPSKRLSADEKKKLQYMQALDLYTPEALKELLCKRNERKRRTTANPQYSIGFQTNRRHRNGNIWEELSAKRARVNKSFKGKRQSGERTGDALPQNGNAKEADNHEDFCAACGKGGQLLMCETCRLVYHLDCLKPPLTEAPKYAWSCPKCLVSGKGSAQLSTEALSRLHSYIGKRAAKEDDRKKLQRKRNEVNYEKSFLDNRSRKLETEMKDQTNLKARLEKMENESKRQLQKLSELVESVRQSNSSSVTSSSSPVTSQSGKSSLRVSSVPATTKDNSSMDTAQCPDTEKLKCDNSTSLQPLCTDSIIQEAKDPISTSSEPRISTDPNDNFEKNDLSNAEGSTESTENESSGLLVNNLDAATLMMGPTSLTSGSCDGLCKEKSLCSESVLPVSMEQQCS